MLWSWLHSEFSTGVLATEYIPMRKCTIASHLIRIDWMPSSVRCYHYFTHQWSIHSREKNSTYRNLESSSSQLYILISRLNFIPFTSIFLRPYDVEMCMFLRLCIYVSVCVSLLNRWSEIISFRTSFGNGLSQGKSIRQHALSACLIVKYHPNFIRCD